MNSNYSLKPIIECDHKKVMEFMIGCKILEVRENHHNDLIESQNITEFVNIYASFFDEYPEPSFFNSSGDLNQQKIRELVEGVRMDIYGLSYLLERESDKKHFVAQTHAWWNEGFSIFEVIYDDQSKKDNVTELKEWRKDSK